MGSLLYSPVRLWLDVIAASHGDQAKLQAEVLALRRQVGFLSARSSAFFKRLYIFFCAPGDSASVGRDLHRRAERILGNPAGPEPELETGGRGNQAEVRDSRPRPKFAPKADTVFKSEDARVIVTPLMAPMANAHAKRWVGSCRRECLDWMLIVNQRHLEAVLHEYCAHDNDEGPHRSRNLRPPASRGDPIAPSDGQISRTVRLGGLLSEYRRVPVAA
ncbi:MAG: transposase [Candidatus Dormibacteraeota bacterium]|nr:transposase [Candidatus Dormibacteraeota bacterium]